ncbi:MAG TPA: hypothetical protein VMU24_03330 [Candidatus Acidoferrales bacterium]|nr:hypothetical protein [Candidatus Acidoferrales bacterium]
MWASLFDMLFGCWHRNYSFPITAKGHERVPAAAKATGMYVVCLDCGKEFPYDWHRMKVLAEGHSAAEPATPTRIRTESAESLSKAA